MSNIYDAYGILALAATPVSTPSIFSIISNECKNISSMLEYITVEPYDFMFEIYWGLGS